MSYKIMFVDDETANLRLLERLFRDSYEIFTASSAEEAIKLLEVHDVAVIVSDQRMPAMNGSDFLKVAAEMRPQTVRIMLTGYTDAADLVEAINSGVVYKYLTKPWINEEFQQTIKRALQHYETSKAQRQLQNRCERLQTNLSAMRDGFVDVILTMLDAKVPDSRVHAERTAALALSIARTFGLERDERETLALSAKLYDVVASCLPDSRLPKTRDEETAMCLAYEACLAKFEKIPNFEEAAGLLRLRFERFDGSGFPVGFQGPDTPISARILAVAEAYDRLRHQSGNSVSIGHDDAVRMMANEAGKRFDPEVIESLNRQAAGIETVEEAEVLVPA